LLSLLVLGMALAMRTGLAAFAKTNSKLMDMRRVTGAQQILHQELEGLMPVFVTCGDAGINGVKAAFFQGEPAAVRMVSSFSLQQGWRGQAQVLEMFVIPGEDGEGVRLLVNESPYTGLLGTARFCSNFAMDPDTGATLARFIPVVASPKSFVLADKLAFCRFTYYAPGAQPGQPPFWTPTWKSKGWPLGVRVEMAPLAVDPSRVQPITVTAPIHIRRDPGKKYEDLY
jgi:hypothetical protein